MGFLKCISHKSNFASGWFMNLICGFHGRGLWRYDLKEKLKIFGSNNFGHGLRYISWKDNISSFLKKLQLKKEKSIIL